MSFGPGSQSPHLPWGETTAAAVDPQWSQQGVDAWKRWATRNAEGFDYRSGGIVQADFDGNDSQGVDYGIRPLLYELNSRGYHTTASNLGSAGSKRTWAPFVTLAPDVGPPRGVRGALERHAPAGYVPDIRGGRRAETVVGYTHESCDPSKPLWQCGHEPTPGERAKADSAFIRAIRSVL